MLVRIHQSRQIGYLVFGSCTLICLSIDDGYSTLMRLAGILAPVATTLPKPSFRKIALGFSDDEHSLDVDGCSHRPGFHRSR